MVKSVPWTPVAHRCRLIQKHQLWSGHQGDSRTQLALVAATVGVSRLVGVHAKVETAYEIRHHRADFRLPDAAKARKDFQMFASRLVK
jgi:hypothetical protein